ncbi:MAG TPA: MBL fold metallo-hydrolase [Bryobacteraceae bacterium]|nr:MBL fold metallo-hydrolase [Bryobacteraceae bacterium]
MSRTTLVRLCGGALFFLGTWVAYTQNANQPPQLTISKVKDDLYQIVGDGGNVAVYVTGEGVIMVDDKYEQDYDQIVAKVKSVTSEPIKYILSTHHHADHSGGNVKFAPTVEIISTVNARANIVEKKQPNAPANITPARIAFTDQTSVFLGGKEVRAKYFGRGHTNGDAVIYFPALKTIHTGDLMAGNTPLIDYPGGGSVIEWTKTLDAAMTLDFDTVIPGHGPVANKDGLQKYRDNVEKLRTRAQGLIRSGKSQAEVAEVMTKEFGWAPTGLQMQWSLPGIMNELK